MTIEEYRRQRNTIDVDIPVIYQGPLTESECANYMFPDCNDKDVLALVYKIHHGLLDKDGRIKDSNSEYAKPYTLSELRNQINGIVKRKEKLENAISQCEKDLRDMPHYRNVSPLRYMFDYLHMKRWGHVTDAPYCELEHPETYFNNRDYTMRAHCMDSLKCDMQAFQYNDGFLGNRKLNIIKEYNRQFCNAFVKRKSKIEVKNIHNVPLTLYGAIIGDIVGSPYEFPKKERMKRTDFEFFSDDCRFTDDTVCTIAIANAIADQVSIVGNITDKLTDMCQVELISLCRNYKVGYGNMYREWLFADWNPEPYNSFGNGSAMRVAACGIAFDSLYDTLRAAECSALPTHNHIDGIKGAQAVAEVMWRIRNGNTKDEIKRAIEFEYGYNLSVKLDEIRPFYTFNATCPGSVPESIIAFLEGNSFEECVRLAVSLGGDTDTMGAITGAMASMMYEIPKDYIEKADGMLTDDLRSQVYRFNRLFEQ